jgi:hypothetical protein
MSRVTGYSKGKSQFFNRKFQNNGHKSLLGVVVTVGHSLCQLPYEFFLISFERNSH